MSMPAEKLQDYPVASIGHHPLILANLEEMEHGNWLKLREN